jgi:hypothetical protein
MYFTLVNCRLTCLTLGVSDTEYHICSSRGKWLCLVCFILTLILWLLGRVVRQTCAAQTRCAKNAHIGDKTWCQPDTREAGKLSNTQKKEEQTDIRKEEKQPDTQEKQPGTKVQKPTTKDKSKTNYKSTEKRPSSNIIDKPVY